MLVLTRTVGTSVVLSDVIIIEVLGIEGDRVKLGFTAPSEVRIVRGELVDSPPNSVQEPEDHNPRGRRHGRRRRP